MRIEMSLSPTPSPLPQPLASERGGEGSEKQRERERARVVKQLYWIAGELDYTLSHIDVWQRCQPQAQTKLTKNKALICFWH